VIAQGKIMSVSDELAGFLRQAKDYYEKVATSSILLLEP
jgi:hypothetical protein